MLRASELGLSMADLELIDMGTVLDMLIEKQNDMYEYDELATEEDVANF